MTIQEITQNLKSIENSKRFFLGKKILIMGLGLHGGGEGVVKWFYKKKAKLIVTDLKSKKELKPSLESLKKFKGITYILGRHREKDFKNVDLVIKNPGVPLDSKYLRIAHQNNIPVETDITIFFRLCPAKIIGITGTRGKSTVTFLIGKILKRVNPKTVMAGNIRKSVLDFLDQIEKETPVVLELSSWQLYGLKNIKKSPHISVITNIYQDHLNRYKNLREYIADKKLIYKYQKPNDYLVLNKEDKRSKNFAFEAKSKIVWFSKREVPKSWPIRLQGEHNLENIAAAICVARILKIPKKIVKGIVENFKGLEGREELLRFYKGVKYINDTTATIPQGTIAALKTLGDKRKKNIILIAGGADKNLDFRELAKYIKVYCKTVILLKGTATSKIKSSFDFAQDRQISSLKTQIYNVNSMAKAAKIAYKISKPGDIVLLSPACASFGLFKHEFDRGEKFIKAVNLL